jgi:uncharacterized protein (TIGR03000 family)
MRHQLLSFVGSSALAVAALLASGPAASAQHHGGGRSGGAYYGGSHGGHPGGGYGGHPGGGYGYHGGYNHYGYGGYGYPFGGFGLGLSFGNFGGGYYGNGGYYDGGSGYYSYYNDPAFATPAYSGFQSQSAYAPNAPYAPPGLASTQARVLVRVPDGASLWVDDYQSQQTGPVRNLTTPATLEPGKPYHYTLKAQWTQDGQTVTHERRVTFQAGQQIAVDLTQPEPGPAPSATPPAPATPRAPATPPVPPPPANIPA